MHPMADILVVDDEVGIRELLSEVLEDEGYDVRVAESAQAALRCRDDKEPDVVLLDIWMPDMDGITLLKEWSRRGLLTMPVLMMSGHATIDTAVEATRIGAMDFLEKPIALNKLLKSVSAALEKGTVQKAWQHAVAEAQAEVARAKAEAEAKELAEHGPPYDLDMARRAMLELDLEQPLRELRDAFERIYFEYQMAKDGGNMTRLAERCGLERTHLYRKIRQLGLEPGRTAQRRAAA